MHFAFTEEQEELRASARAFLADHSGSEAVRAAMASERGFDPEVWKRIGSQLGWPAVIVPEADGGLGLGQVELVALAEVMGEHLLCSPFFSTVCLATNALSCAGPGSRRAELLPAIAEGQRTAALVVSGPDASDVSATVRRDGSELVLSGRVRHVVDGHSADWLLVAARDEASASEDGVSLLALEADGAGIERRALPTMDQTRRLAEIELRQVRVPADALLGEEGAAWPGLTRALQLGAIALAAEQVGGAQRCLDLTVAYAKERKQFEQPIASFQSIKHACADMMVRVEAARSAVYYAGCVADEDPQALPAAAALAKATASDAFTANAADALQIHGGVGFTWEYDVHLYFKRARSSQSLLGDPTFHRELVARQLGL